MESNQFELNFYKRIILCEENIFNIFSFLTIQDEKQCLNCCENANQLIKYYYYRKYCKLHKNKELIQNQQTMTLMLTILIYV